MGKTKKEEQKRTFTIHAVLKSNGCPTKFQNKDYTGVYKSNSPSGAASKALTQLCRVKAIKGQCSMVISIRETTRGSKKKVFVYKANRVKLDKPIELAGRKIEYMNKVLKAGTPPSCKKSSKSSGRKASRSKRSRKK